jgi:hypothetical protein
MRTKEDGRWKTNGTITRSLVCLPKCLEMTVLAISMGLIYDKSIKSAG